MTISNFHNTPYLDASKFHFFCDYINSVHNDKGVPKMNEKWHKQYNAMAVTIYEKHNQEDYKIFLRLKVKEYFKNYDYRHHTMMIEREFKEIDFEKGIILFSGTYVCPNMILHLSVKNKHKLKSLLPRKRYRIYFKVREIEVKRAYLVVNGKELSNDEVERLTTSFEIDRKTRKVIHVYAEVVWLFRNIFNWD